MSPSNSSYSQKRDDILDLLDHDIAKYSAKGEGLVCGDFNGRTALAEDYILHDTSRHVPVPDTYLGDVALERSNMDRSNLDMHGRTLLHVCKASGLRRLCLMVDYLETLVAILHVITT